MVNKSFVVILILLAIVAIALVAIFIAQSNSGDTMVVEKGDHVSVDYVGTLDDGTQFDSSVGRAPLEFDVGAGQMIKGFDDGVLSMKLNETKNVKISAKDAYGEIDPKLFVDVSLDDLAKNNITPKTGMKLYAQGQQVTIIKVTNTTATIDFNHPLAGKTLNFKITMLKIEKKKK
ncbi:MAG: peptidylprolyl isomerase [Candidatus Aenigmarchaeota archaeon]|nr:peptidylprolyl isomerase [Candidatus Aenigmarchaeota archaeon]